MSIAKGETQKNKTKNTLPHKNLSIQDSRWRLYIITTMAVLLANVSAMMKNISVNKEKYFKVDSI